MLKQLKLWIPVISLLMINNNFGYEQDYEHKSLDKLSYDLAQYIPQQLEAIDQQKNKLLTQAKIDNTRSKKMKQKQLKPSLIKQKYIDKLEQKEKEKQEKQEELQRIQQQKSILQLKEIVNGMFLFMGLGCTTYCYYHNDFSLFLNPHYLIIVFIIQYFIRCM